MVQVDTYISGFRPTRTRIVRHTCDLCGRECIQSGTKEERLYDYGEDQLCFECLWDALTTDGTVEIAE